MSQFIKGEAFGTKKNSKESMMNTSRLKLHKGSSFASRMNQVYSDADSNELDNTPISFQVLRPPNAYTENKPGNRKIRDFHKSKPIVHPF